MCAQHCEALVRVEDVGVSTPVAAVSLLSLCSEEAKAGSEQRVVLRERGVPVSAADLEGGIAVRAGFTYLPLPLSEFSFFFVKTN